MQILQVFFLARLARSCTEAFLEKSCKNLARKICKISFLQDFDQILQENYLQIFSCKTLQDFSVLQEKLHFSTGKTARFVQDLM